MPGFGLIQVVVESANRRPVSFPLLNDRALPRESQYVCRENFVRNPQYVDFLTFGEYPFTCG